MAVAAEAWLFIVALTAAATRITLSLAEWESVLGTWGWVSDVCVC